jgi:hypothetical protein
MEKKPSSIYNQKGHAPERNQLVTVGDLDSFKREILEELKCLIEKNESAKGVKQWLRSAEVRKMLGVSAGTLQNFRVNGLLKFTKIGTVLFYKYEDIIALLNSNSSRK